MPWMGINSSATMLISKDTPNDSQYPPHFLQPNQIQPHIITVNATNNNIANIDVSPHLSIYKSY